MFFNWNVDSYICHPCCYNDLSRSIQLIRKWKKFCTALCLHNLSRKKCWYKSRKIHLPITCYHKPVTQKSGYFHTTRTAATEVLDNQPRRGTVLLHGEDRTGGNSPNIPFTAELAAFSPLMLVAAIADIQWSYRNKCSRSGFEVQRS